MYQRDAAPGIRATDYLMWAVTAPGEHFGLPDERLMGLDSAALHGLARDAIAGGRSGCSAGAADPASLCRPPGVPLKAQRRFWSHVR